MAKTRQIVYVNGTLLFHSSNINIKNPQITYFTKRRKRNFQLREKLRLFLLSAVPEPKHASGYLICFWRGRGTRRGYRSRRTLKIGNIGKKKAFYGSKIFTPTRSPSTAASVDEFFKAKNIAETFHLSPSCQYSITPVSSPRNVSKRFVPCYEVYSSSQTLLRHTER
jgi:hypothetical protein